MGRGRDKIIRGSDLQNMSPAEMKAALSHRNRMTGTAVVRNKQGNAVYGEGAKPGAFNEDKLS